MNDEIKFTGAPPKKPMRMGIVQAIDAETGEVIEECRNAMTLLPAKHGVCPECAVDHAHDQPHNLQSLYYAMAFQAKHGRSPTWTDAMAHCSDRIKAMWREGLREQYRKNGLEIPADLLDQDEERRVR